MAMDNSVFVLALDGPVGSGKGTIGQRLASQFGFHYLDSGALYRVVAYVANQQNISPSETDKLADMLDKLNIEFVASADGGSDILLNSQDITDQIRNEKTAKLASDYARVNAVRKLLLDLQRRCAIGPGLVADGRDMGSVVFPHAHLKIFLTASAQKRGERRYKQLIKKDFDGNLARLIDSIRERDLQDENREHSPLKPADDAIILDTSDLDIDDVVAQIAAMLDKKLAVNLQ